MAFLPVRRLVAIALSCAVFALPAFAKPASLDDCRKLTDYRPREGEQGKDVVWVATPDAVVERMLRMAAVERNDYLVDLGAGDGKIAIAAARDYGAKALGIEYNPKMVRLAQCMVEVAGVGARARIVEGDIFRENFSNADIVTLYLMPHLNLCVRHRILAMRPGTRVVSHRFNMSGWEPDRSDFVEGEAVHLWIVPARVAGGWVFREHDGKERFRVRLSQTFQAIGGEMTIDGERRVLLGASLRGGGIRFSFNDAKSMPQSFTGRVNGHEITGVLGLTGEEGVALVGSRLEPPPAAPWARMDEQCGQFYAAK